MATAEQEQPHSKRAKSRIPTFKTIEEEAAFWDTHDLAEFEDELEVVAEDIRFVVTRGEPKKPMTVRLGQTDLARLTKQVQTLGVGPSTLARMWILEHLREEAGKAVASDRSEERPAIGVT